LSQQVLLSLSERVRRTVASPGVRRTGGVVAAIALSAGFLQAPAVSAEETLIEPQMISSGDTDFLVAYYDFNEGPPGTTGTGTVYNRADGRNQRHQPAHRQRPHLHRRQANHQQRQQHRRHLPPLLPHRRRRLARAGRRFELWTPSSSAVVAAVDGTKVVEVELGSSSRRAATPLPLALSPKFKSEQVGWGPMSDRVRWARTQPWEP
jgi:hypothetical protein